MVSSKVSQLAKEEGSLILRALSSSQWLRDPRNLERLKALNAAAEEMDRLGKVGLTIAVEELKVLTTSESVAEWFGATGEFYIITTLLDGSGRPMEYKTRFFQGIKRGERLPLGEGGMLVGFLENPRWFVDFHLVVMESDSDVRLVGEAIERARKESGLEDVLRFVGAAAAFDPTLVTRVITGVNLFLTVLSKILQENGDDHVATVHDFYLKHQGFGFGRHPAEGLRRFQNVEIAYRIDLTKL